MRARELFEGLSEILYHATGLHNVEEILAIDTLRLTPDIGTSSEQSHRPKQTQVYYMSFSRSRVGNYHHPVHKGETGQSIIVLDGRKLMADGYSGKPVEYWGFGDKDEMEDRIFSDKPIIPNASKYITEIHTYLNLKPTFRKASPMTKILDPNAPDVEEPKDKDREAIFIRLIRKVYRRATQLGIALYIYDDADAMGLLNKKKAIKSVSDIKTDVAPQKRLEPSYRRKNPFGYIMELLALDGIEKLSPDTKKKLYNMAGWYRDDTIRSLEADIHNARSGAARPKLDILISKMKQMKIFNVADLIDHIITKFKETA